MRQLPKPSMPGKPSRFPSPRPSRCRRARMSRSPRRFPRRFPPSLPRPCSKNPLRQSRCARRQPRRRDRHHRRPGLRLRAFQAARLPARQGSRADVRRRPVADNTPSVLKTLADECTKAMFFPIGKHATYHPEILKQVAAAGHTVGSHTWSHAHLDSKKLTEQQVKEEIEKGFSAVKLALGAAPAPFFRFPALQHPPELVDLSRRRATSRSSPATSTPSTSRRSKAAADRRHRDEQGSTSRARASS